MQGHEQDLGQDTPLQGGHYKNPEVVVSGSQRMSNPISRVVLTSTCRQDGSAIPVKSQQR